MLELGQTAPFAVMKFLKDDFDIVTASGTKLATTLTERCEAGASGNPPPSVSGHATEQGDVRMDTGLAQPECGQTCGRSDVLFPPEGAMVHEGRFVPWFAPIASVLHSKWALAFSPSVRASAAALAEGGWWTQQRLFDVGLAADPYCRACCQLEHESKVGSLWHRLCECKARVCDVVSNLPRWLRDLAYARPRDPLFAEGVPLRPVFPGAPLQIRVPVGPCLAEGRIAVGQAYTDGALSGSVPRANRAGWAFIVDDGSSRPWGEYGTCDEPYASVLRAELRALLELLRVTVGPITAHVDNMAVVDGVASGRDWCCDSRREGADLWREIWDRLDDLEGLVSVVKIKAHLTFADVVTQRIDFRHWIGNVLADKYAKAGAKLAKDSSPTEAITSQWHRACDWYKWVLHRASEWVEDTAPSAPLPPPVPSRQQAGTSPPSPSHEVWRNHEWAWCRKCGAHGRWAHGANAPASLRRTCGGTIAERAGLRQGGHRDGDSHRDDGRCSLAFLRSRGASLFLAPSPEGCDPTYGRREPGRS